MLPTLNLINWQWLEDLLVRACEAEVREFGERHRDEDFFAFCLEYEGLDGTIGFAYGSRRAVEAAWRALDADERETPAAYREVELRPEFWRYRGEPVLDPDRAPSGIEAVLEKYRENMGEQQDPEVRQFHWLRFEYLVECVVQRLIDRGAFRYLNHEPVFVAFCANEHESLEELEDRLEKLYPQYRRATVGWSQEPRMGELRPLHCEDGRVCAGALRPEERCTCCGVWCCPVCRPEHGHPELAERLPLFRD